MESIPIEHSLILASILFTLGLIGVLTRRNIVFVLMSLEIMLNASGLAFILGGARWNVLGTLLERSWNAPGERSSQTRG